MSPEYQYCIEGDPLRRKIANPDIPLVEGYITVPEAPGPGIELG
jgi:L-alanine-DL-glutamate epimerase-like enolase superfamily enzyme